MNSRRVLTWMVAVLLVMVLIGGRKWMSRPEVQVIELESSGIRQTIVTSGYIRAAARIAVGSLIQGRISRLRVREGDKVLAGQVLVRLEDEEATAQLKRAEAIAREAAAELIQLEADLAKRDRESVVQARTELAQLGDRLRRAEALFADGIAGVAERDEARRNRILAESRLESALFQARASAENGGRYRVLLARLDRAQAEVTLAELQLGHTRLRAPVNAVVVERTAEVGQVVGVGESLLTLVADGPIEVVFEPDETNILEIEEGQTARVTTQAIPGTVFPAKVKTIVPAVNQQQGTVQVILELEGVHRLLLPDMTVSVDVLVDEREKVIVVPRSAVVEKEDGTSYVWTVYQNRPAPQLVQLGLQDTTRVEIVEGLREGQHIIIQPPDGLDTGNKVRAVRVTP